MKVDLPIIPPSVTVTQQLFQRFDGYENHVAARARASASSLQLLDRCEQKWAFQYLSKIREPDSEATRLGSRFHKYRDDYFKTGKQPPVQADQAAVMAASGLEHLPIPRPGQHEHYGLYIEKGLGLGKGNGNIPTPWGNLIGKMDVFLLDQGLYGYRPSEQPWHDVEGVPLVIDHKSTAGEAYIKGPEDLQDDLQSVIYASAAYWLLPGAVHTDLLWHYVTKKKPFSPYPIRLRTERKETEQRFSDIVVPLLKKHLRLRAERDRLPDSYEKNYLACSDYNKQCIHWNYCPKSKSTVLDMLCSPTNNKRTSKVQNTQQLPVLTQLAQGQQQPQFAPPPQFTPPQQNQPQPQPQPQPQQNQPQPQQPQFAPQQPQQPQPQPQQPQFAPQPQQPQFAPPQPGQGPGALAAQVGAPLLPPDAPTTQQAQPQTQQQNGEGEGDSGKKKRGRPAGSKKATLKEDELQELLQKKAAQDEQILQQLNQLNQTLSSLVYVVQQAASANTQR